jgi:hypothetical protein
MTDFINLNLKVITVIIIKKNSIINFNSKSNFIDLSNYCLRSFKFNLQEYLLDTFLLNLPF